MSPSPRRGLRIKYDAPLNLSDKQVKWRTARLALAGVITALTLVLVVLVTVAFPAQVAGDGTYLTRRAPLATGVPQVQDYVLVGEDAAGLTSWTRLIESLYKDHSVVRIVAVPGDEVASIGGRLYINGKPTTFRLQVASGERLSAKYLVLCKSGTCEANSLFTVDTTAVVGSVSWDEAKERARLQEAPATAAE